MNPARATSLLLLALALAAGAAVLAGAGGGDEGITIAWPKPFSRPARPLVVFPHGRHARALEQEGCAACHPRSAYGDRLETFRLAGRPDCQDEAGCRRGWHDLCIGCHLRREKEKKSKGPSDCGLCHRPDRSAVKLQAAGFDYARHARHSEALGGREGCGRCHHVREERNRACRDCHRPQSGGGLLSWREAAHLDCTGCHLAWGREGQPAGPLDCTGCHREPSTPAGGPGKEYRRPDDTLPDRLWVQTAGTPAAPVPFDHRRHEPQARFCTDCHHRALRPCGACHDLEGRNPAGGGVSLPEAHHRATAAYSCRGCHRARLLERPECAACHQDFPSDRGGLSCAVCHRGPAPAEASPPAPGEAFFALAKAFSSAVEQPPLVTLGDDGGRFLKTEFAHSDIVVALEGECRSSPLAGLFGRFHADGVFCAGCHHHQPVRQRPLPCSACHDAAGSRVEDRPPLREAFHRQCLGCHRRLGLDQGCTACHTPRPDGEVTP